jgi:hypothetical protein
VRALAENIATAASPARTISLEMKNVSSLGASDAAGVRQGLEANLSHRGFRLGAATSAEARVELTLSESEERFVWVAETRIGDAERIAIVDVARTRENSPGKPVDSLVLDRRLVWQQSDTLLDFAFFQGSGATNSTVWILEPERILFYRNAGEQWLIERAIAITHSKPWPRDLRGTIDAFHQSIYLPELACVMSGGAAGELQCSAAPADKGESIRSEAAQTSIEGHEGSDTVALGSTCGEDSVVLATGTADWTQPDLIQAYLEKDGRAVPSGDPLQTDGPITGLNWASEGEARTVVHNLKTGNYEAYFVTATCGH